MKHFWAFKKAKKPPLCIPSKMRYKANMTHNPNNRPYSPLCVIKVSYKKLSPCFCSFSPAEGGGRTVNKITRSDPPKYGERRAKTVQKY